MCIPHVFNHDQNRKILAFCKDPEMQNAAIEAGAHFAGGKDLIKKIQVRHIIFVVMKNYIYIYI